MSNILTTLSQSQAIANDVLAKVREKGYALSTDLGDLASKDEVAKSDLASALVTEIDGKANTADLGALASKNEVAKTDLASALSTEISNATSNISTQTGRIDTLVGSTSGDDAKSVRTISAEEVAKVVASAPDDFDTLKEIADWIENHSDDAAAMNSAITALQGKTVLGTHEVDGQQVEYTTVKAYVEAVMAAAALSGSDSIDITNGVVSAIVNAGNGLSSGANGISLAEVVASTNGTGGSNGAMTAAQAEKLAGLEIATTQQVNDMIAGLDNL